jgi:tetratricopeptide (TPR) repeat protein
MPQNGPRGPRRDRLVACLAALIAGAVAAPAITNGYVEDAHWVIEQRPLLAHPPSARALLLEPFWPRTFGGGVWRPAALATYALDRQVTASPHWLHAMDVLWAALAAGVLTLLAIRLAGPGIGLAAGLLFAVHPVHVEVTASGIGRAELMAAIGYGAALLCASHARADRRWLIGVTLASLFAIASKENAATLPAAVLLVAAGQAAFGDKDWRRALRAALPAAVCAAAPIVLYFAFRPVVTGATFAAGGIAPGLRGLGLPARAAAMLAVSPEWWRLLFAPIHLSADYSPAQVAVVTAFSARHAVGLALLAAGGWAAWTLRRRAPGVALGLAWTAITLAPVSNVLIPTEILVAERTLYLPSWGVVLALASAGALLPWRPRAKAVLLVAVMLAGAVRSVARAGVWHDDDRWFTALQHDAPRSYRTLWLLGQDAFAAQRWGSGERYLRDAIAAAPDLPGAREDLAAFYAAGRLWRPAVELLEQSLALDSGRARPWGMLPRALLGLGDTTAAARTAAAGVQRFPHDAQVALGALGALLAAGECAQARVVADGLRSKFRPEAQVQMDRDMRSCASGPKR